VAPESRGAWDALLNFSAKTDSAAPVVEPRGLRMIRALELPAFDRFARSVSHLARALDEFTALGIEFISLHEAVDTSTPMGRAMFHIAGAFAELERDIIRERVKAGLQNARRPGRGLAEQVLKMASAGRSARGAGSAVSDTG